MRALWLAHALVAGGLLASAFPARAHDASPFPARGVVRCDASDGLTLRTGPPQASAFSYTLAPPVCGLGNGSKFFAMEQHPVANGEVWYRVRVTEVARAVGEAPCPPVPFPGWMMGRPG